MLSTEEVPMWRRIALILLVALVSLGFSGGRPAELGGSIAEVYYWKAKPGKLEEYKRYIRDYAAPIDREAQRRGAFISVTTYISQKTDSSWTHMRIFVLRDHAQQDGLQKALDDAKLRLHPDEQERNRQAAYAETLRDAVGHETLEILH
jgi:hypothetical protein